MSLRKLIHNFALPFFLIFLLSFFLLNWKSIGWVFNFRALKRVGENKILNSHLESTPPPYQYVESDNQLEITKLNLQAPLVFIKNQDPKVIHQALDQGVVHYPGSALPGEKGMVVLLGHSAPPNWPDIKYDRVFSNLNNLETGDEIKVSFNHRLYPYQVIEKHIFSKAEEETFLAKGSQQKLLILSTCYPPGQDQQRLVIVAELEK